MNRATIMMQMIHAACAHGQRQFDGWVIGKAFYGKYDGQEPVSFETQTQRMRQGFARLSTKGYGKGHNVVQGLELVLVRPSCADGDARGNACAGAFPGRHGCRLLRDRLEAGDGIRAAAEDSHGCLLSGAPHFRPDVLTFSSEGLKRFLKDSGDTNPIHYGETAVVPGLWILERLQGLWECKAAQGADAAPGRHDLPQEFHIRFFHPVYTGQPIRLVCSENTITGVCGGLTYFLLRTNNL